MDGDEPDRRVVIELARLAEAIVEDGLRRAEARERERLRERRRSRVRVRRRRAHGER